ncbi:MULTISPECIES: BglG family transcription antiterminator [Mammaliicoccus]|jgi:activator of the mannose operon (transcriptional antiterminator)|uniref:PRD domain-containing protein n=1 Tax=Mammaliicoccus lentus TaxID=42858 RepID=A0ABS6GVC6_MAMLE|nr:PRD domain-containing protein [Mammaliicoccus lentus]MBU6113412.1 PRD domain-containing protein [Mammaliicoccus lentus]
MLFSSKEEQVINYLNFYDFVAANEISDKLLVSSKTIYRLVKKINEITKDQYGERMIESETGKGYKINKFYIDKNIYSIVTIKEENFLLETMLTLLFQHPKKLRKNHIFCDSYMSESTEERRIRSIIEYLNEFNIDVYNMHNLLYVKGEEIDIRRAINSILLTINKNQVLGDLGLDINASDKHFLDKQISLIEENLEVNLYYPYDVSIFTHLYMVLKRYREGRVNQLENQDALDEEEKNKMNRNKEIKTIADILTRNLSKHLCYDLHELESFFIFQNLYSLNIEKKEYIKKDKLNANKITIEFVSRFFDINKEEVNENEKLYQDLYNHILPMIGRIRMGIKLENNMLKELILEYKETFLKVLEISNKINKNLNEYGDIDEAEVGYISLYFEKYKLEKEHRKKVLLVCSTGIGTSELLQIRLKNSFPNLKIVSTMSHRQMQKNSEFIDEEVDIIFSTIRVENKHFEKPVICISPVLSDKDIDLIDYSLKELN